MGLVRLWTKNHCAGEDQQQFSSHESEVEVGGYQVRVFSCIVRRRYQATTTEVKENLVFALAVCRMCRLVKVLQFYN
jgi:hypothetical protein